MKALRFNISVPRYLALKALGAANKKIYYQGKLAAIRLDDIPEPVLPGPDWIKIKTHLCGFCASDLNLIFLKDSPTASPFGSFPCVLGHEVSGEIIETGHGIKDFGNGDRVTVAPHLSCVTRGIDPVCNACASGRVGNCENFAEGKLAPGMFIGICKDVNGGFAPYMVAHESQLFALPPEVSDEEGAMIEPLSVALQTVLDNRPVPGDHALVIGFGVIGSLVVQSIRAVSPKCKITVSEPSMNWKISSIIGRAIEIRSKLATWIANRCSGWSCLKLIRWRGFNLDEQRFHEMAIYGLTSGRITWRLINSFQASNNNS